MPRSDEAKSAMADRAAARRRREQLAGSARRRFDQWLSRLSPADLEYVHAHLDELLAATVLEAAADRRTPAEREQDEAEEAVADEVYRR